MTLLQQPKKFKNAIALLVGWIILWGCILSVSQPQRPLCPSLPPPSFLNSIFLPHLLHLSCRQNKQPWNFQFWFRVGISISYFDILRKQNVNFFRHNSCYRHRDPDYNIYAWRLWCIMRWLVDDPCSLSSCDTYILPPAHTNSSTYYVLFQLHLLLFGALYTTVA